MNVVRCRRCRRNFEVVGNLGGICPECVKDEEATYKLVRAFVKENPGVSIIEVSEICHVSVAKIVNYLKEERLETTKNSRTYLVCKNCGAAITTGIFCKNCKRIHGDLGVVAYVSDEEIKSAGMMHTSFFAKRKE